jgi:hypothetical protein
VVRGVVIGLVIAALTLTGCSSVTAGSGEPITGRWTVSQAQQHYLDYVAQGNEDIAIVNRLICSCVAELDTQQLANACAAVASDNVTLAHNLETGQWPENAVSAIDSLVAAVEAQGKGYRSCSEAASVASMRSYEASATKTTTQASEVRRVLDLPPVGAPEMAPRSVVSSPPGAY